MEEQDSDIIQGLGELASLNQSGALSDNEFTLAKTRLIDEFWPTPNRATTADISRVDADPVNHVDIGHELRELGELHSAQALNDDEFALAKAQLLDAFVSAGRRPKGVKQATSRAPLNAEATQTSAEKNQAGPDDVRSPALTSVGFDSGALSSVESAGRVSGKTRGTVALFVALSVAAAILVPLGFVYLAPKSISPAIVESTAPSQTSTPSETSETSESPQVPISSDEILRNQIDVDRPSVEALLDSWVPQLSAKKPGTVSNNVVYGYDDILADYQSLKARYPDALLLWSGEYSTFKAPDYYVVVVSQSYQSGSDAIAWCVSQGIGRDDCYAKRLSHTGDPTSSTIYQSS